jgi:hypothetical protein
MADDASAATRNYLRFAVHELLLERMNVVIHVLANVTMHVDGR